MREEVTVVTAVVIVGLDSQGVELGLGSRLGGDSRLLFLSVVFSSHGRDHQHTGAGAGMGMADATTARTEARKKDFMLTDGMLETER